MKTGLSLVIVFMLLVGMQATLQAAERTALSLATSVSGGSWYGVGTTLATLWSEKLASKGITVTAQATGGATQNIELLRQGEVEISLNYNVIAIPAWTGTGIYRNNQYTDMRTIARLNDNVAHVLLLEEHVSSGTIEDVTGTSFNLGLAGSGTHFEGGLMLAANGLNVRSAETLGFGAAAEALRDRRIDGAIFQGDVPHPTVLELISTGVPVRILSYTDDHLANINEQLDYLDRAIIPGGTYDHHPEDIETVTQPLFVMVRSDADEELVYELTKILFENVERLREDNRALHPFSLEDAVSGLRIPLHPGAYRYLEAAGVNIPDNLVPPEL